jgi:spore coat protein A, manganese oxidase
MTYSRRDILRYTGLAALETSCIQPRPESRLLPSLAPLPAPFQVPLPIVPTLQPSRVGPDTDYYDVTVRPSSARILSGLDTAIWGYDGIFPGPSIQARVGRRVSLLLHNALPVPIVNHLHGGRTAPESDGYPTDLILPAAGFPHPHMNDPMAKLAEGSREYIYANQQRAATLWYHDHRMDFTASQVWRGLAGFYILRDSEEERLGLPQGDKEIALLICDRSFEADGSFRYPALDPSLRSSPGVDAAYMGGVLGDVILVNGAPWPKLDVSNVKYRFRILNASNARRYELQFDSTSPVSFTQIGSDGGLLAAPLPQRAIRIAPSERFDVIVDFSKCRLGSSVTLVNRDAEGPASQIMRFDVVHSEHDDSNLPAILSEPSFEKPEQATVTRVLDFSYQRFSHSWRINGQPFDPSRMDARPKLDALEIWRLQTDFSHPLHLHLVHFQVLGHSGRPGPYDAGWKDTIDLGPGQVANILVRFTGYRGRYVFHCHNLEHEDMSMMGNFEVV